MLLKCYTQYVSKFGKLSTGHRAGKGQFSFQSQSKTMPKNVQTTSNCSHLIHQQRNVQISPSQAQTVCEPRTSFQMFKLDLEKAEEPEIKFPTSAGSSKKQKSSRKTSTSSSLTTLKPLTVWITTNWKMFKEMGIPDHLTCLL